MRIIIDRYNLQSYPGAFLVTDDYSFIKARQKILEYKISRNIDSLILVNNHPYTVWFYDIENENDISVEHILPSRKLYEKFKNVDLDRDLEEADIVYLDLINQPIEPTEISIINKYIGPFLFNIPDLQDQMYLITSFAANPPKKFINSSYLLKKWSKYLDMINYDYPIAMAIISKIKECDQDFCKLINKLIYVSNSKYLLIELMHDNRGYLESNLRRPISELEMFLSETRFYVSLNDQYEQQIENLFRSLYQEDRNTFFQEKGDYKASLKAYLALAKSISNDEKEFISSKYKRNIDFELEEKIRSLIKPEITPPPILNDLSLTLQIEAWLKWAVEKFIPFKFFLDEFQNEADIKLVEEYANDYSDWLNQNYEAIVLNGFKTNYNNVSVISNELNYNCIIWLIIDGFPSAYVETLKTILKSNGINKFLESYHFAAIPTITELGIPTQLSGMVPQSEAFTTNREESLKRAFNSKKIVFKSNIKSFSYALESDFDICCLHWQEIDELMHKEDNDIENGRLEEIKRLLNIRIKQIANVIKTNTNKKVKLIISTDHGQTKCLSKGQKIKNSALIEACRDNPKERCLELIGPLTKVNIDENEVYYLKANRTLNTKDWVSAKGYRYFGRFDYGYRHGGLTPEETIVPFLVCEISQSDIIPIKANYGGINDLQLGYTEFFKITLKNENNVAVLVHNIEIIEDKNFFVEVNQQIEPMSFKTIDGKIKLSKSTIVKEGKTILSVSIDYSLFGEKHNIASTFTVPIKRSINENLDNLFT